MSDSQVITIWERYSEDKEVWGHNHISDGYYPDEDKPRPKCENQVSG